MCAELCRRFKARGYRVTLATNPKSLILQRLEGTGVEILPLALLKDIPQVAWRLPSEAKQLADYIRRENVALVHGHASFDCWTAACAIRGQKLGVPLVRTKHNLKRIRGSLTNRWYYGRAIDRLIAPSRAVEEHLLSSDVVPNERVHYIPNGIPIDRVPLYDSGKAKAREELGVPPDAELVVYVSRLTRRKDPATLIRAALPLREKHPALLLLVAGEHALEDRAGLEQIAAGDPAIRFLGHRDDVPRILAAADLFVLPSLSEPFGLAPLEAMLARVPVIVSDADGFRDYMRDGENGLVFPKGDVEALRAAIERMLSDAALRARVTEEGEHTVRGRFHAERMIDETEALYRELLGRTPNR
jgi:glycosyltransferase involved in cell wall biosynthesis